MVATKFDFSFDSSLIEQNNKRLINQLWKLIPMYENGEAWQEHLETLIEEISGLYSIFDGKLNYLILLSKLEGLKDVTEFSLYRKVVFTSIRLLGDLNG